MSANAAKGRLITETAFRDWNEQQANAKKDNEPPSTIANGRERRRVLFDSCMTMRID